MNRSAARGASLAPIGRRRQSGLGVPGRVRCLMFRSRRYCVLATAAAFASLYPIASVDARGGRSHGRSPAMASAHPAVRAQSPADPPAKPDPPAAATGPNLKSVGVLPTPPAPPTPAPAAAIGVPTPRPAAVAPLSAALPSSTALATGGSTGVSLPGGGHEGLQACLEFWDRETHMTRAEWKVACQDSIKRRAGISLNATMPKSPR